MKKPILLYLFISATSLAFAADYYLKQGSDVDILNLENWSATEITTSDILNIQNDGTTAVLDGEGNTLSFNHMNIRGNVQLDVLGSGNSLEGVGTANSNVYLGSNANKSSTFNILGYGNSFSDKSGWSFMMGNVSSESGETLLRIHSSKQNTVDEGGNVLVDNSNKFTIPSSVNTFIYGSTQENSSAKNTISVGDNSVLTFQTDLYIGANSSTSNSLKSGTAEIVFDGTNSILNATKNTYIGSNSAGQAGGDFHLILGGENNTFSASNNVMVGSATSYVEGISQSGGTNGIYITGTNNNFTTSTSIMVSSAIDMTDGTNEFVVSGNNNTVNMIHIDVGNRNSSKEISGGTNRFLISGNNNVITATGSINVYSPKQSGGDISFEVAGRGNEVYFSSNNTVGGAMSGGTARWVLGGENNSASYVNVMSVMLGRTAMTGGQASLEIRGKNNTATFFNVFMGNENTTNGTAKIIVEGSGHTINIRNELQTYFSGEIDENGKAMGGGFKFIADADGLSTVNVFNMATAFNGLIEVDFSKYVVKNSDVGDVFTLISMTNNSNNLIENVGIFDQFFDIVGSDDYEILLGDESLGRNTLAIRVFSTNVPEPSTYAMLFGVIALGFAIYRKRK